MICLLFDRPPFISLLYSRYTLIDQKMTQTLTQSVDIDLINAAQSIIYNIFAQDTIHANNNGGGGSNASSTGTPHHHSQHTNLQVNLELITYKEIIL